jgi:hypothetical protein
MSSPSPHLQAELRCVRLPPFADVKPFLASTKTKHFIEETKHDLATRPVWRTMDQSLGELTVQQTR